MITNIKRRYKGNHFELKMAVFTICFNSSMQIFSEKEILNPNKFKGLVPRFNLIRSLQTKIREIRMKEPTSCPLTETKSVRRLKTKSFR